MDIKLGLELLAIAREHHQSKRSVQEHDVAGKENEFLHKLAEVDFMLQDMRKYVKVMAVFRS